MFHRICLEQPLLEGIKMFRRLLYGLIIVGTLMPSAMFAQGQDFSPCDWKKVEETWWEIEDTTNLDGRLGSTREAFEAIYGEPVEDDFFTEYDVDGCGSVLVSYDPEGYVTDITISSPRPDDVSGNETHEADWPLFPAFAITNSFVPLDWVCKDFQIQPPPFGYVIEECSSQALLNQVPTSAWDHVDNTPAYGSYAVILHNTDQASKFWMITITLAFDPEDFPEFGN